MEEKDHCKLSCENKDSNEIAHMSMESVGSIDFFKCNKCPFMALTAKDIQFHWQTSHSNKYKTSDLKAITVKCPGCSGIFNSEVSLKTHLRSHHKMCAKDINKLVQNLIEQFKKNQEYIDNMEVLIDGHPDVNQNNLPLLIEVPPDPNQFLFVNNKQPINVINIGGSTTNYIINASNGVNNSKQLVINTNNQMKSNNGNMASYQNQAIIKSNISNDFNIAVPQKHTKTSSVKSNSKTANRGTSKLYDSLTKTASVSNLLGIQSIFPAVQQGRKTESISQYVCTEKSPSNHLKASLCLKKKSSQSDSLTFSKGANQKTDICVKSTQTVTSKIMYNIVNDTINLTKNTLNKNFTNLITTHDKNIVSTDDIAQTNLSVSVPSVPKEISEEIKRKSLKKNQPNTAVITANSETKTRKNPNLRVCGISKCSVHLMAGDKLDYHRSCHVNNNSQDLHCPECKSNNFPTCQSLHDHLWAMHKIDLELHTCDICQYKSFKKIKLFFHMNSHYKEKKYHCEKCSKAFKNSKQLACHRKTHLQYVTCDICQIVVKSARKLFIHKQSTHEKMKGYHCDFCVYSCATKDSLRLHVIRHLGTKDLNCPHCLFKTGDRNVLRRHVQIHTNKKTYSCKYCPYSCIHATSYKSHVISKHSDKVDEVMLSCQQCSFTTFSKQKFQVHSFAHKEGLVKIAPNKSLSERERNAKTKDASKCREVNENTEAVIENDIIIDVTDQNSASLSHINSEENTNITHCDRIHSNFMENNVEALPVQANLIYSKDNGNFFSNAINSMSSTTNNVFVTNNSYEGFYDSGNKIENVYDSNSINGDFYNNVDSNAIQYNQTFDNVMSNVDTDANDTYYPNYESNLIINEETPSSENTANLNLCAVDNATDGLIESVENLQPLNAETNKTSKPRNENVKVTSNIFVKDILDLAASHIKTIPPNIYASDIQKSASHTPIILINPKTQTNNRIMGANLFTSNIINSSYSESSGSSQMLQLPLQSSSSPMGNSVPRKKPKISVKSNLILKGPDRLDSFDLQGRRNGKTSEFNITSSPFALENYNMPLDFMNNSQTIDSNSMNTSSDIYNTEHNYLSNYLMNSDFAMPNIQSPMISNNTTIIQNNLNTIQTIPIESNLTDMSDVKLENKPYLSNQTETMMPSLIENSVHDTTNMYFNVPIHVPIKFEQKMDMLSSFVNQNNEVFENDPVTTSMPSSSAVEDVPQTFESVNGGYNQSLYPFEDNYYFENDFITETLDGQEIIVLDDTWSDVKSISNQFKSTNTEHQFRQNIPLTVNINEMPVKEKPRIISEVQITGSNLCSLGGVKKIGLPFETPLNRNTFNETDFPIDQQDIIFNQDEQY